VEVGGGGGGGSTVDSLDEHAPGAMSTNQRRVVLEHHFASVAMASTVVKVPLGYTLLLSSVPSGLASRSTPNARPGSPNGRLT
jgi:hypothetical protein